MANLDTTRLPGTWGIDKEVSAIPTMPGQRLITIVAPFLNGPVDKPFLVARDDYKKLLGGYNSKFSTPDYGFLCVEETLKSANSVLVCRVHDNTTGSFAEFKNDMIHIRTKYPTEVYNNLPVSFRPGQYVDEVIMVVGDERYTLSVDPKADNYISKLGDVSKIYEVVSFNPDATIVEAVMSGVTLLPSDNITTGNELTITVAFDKVPDIEKINIEVDDKFTIKTQPKISGNNIVATYTATSERGLSTINVTYSTQPKQTKTITVQ